MTKKDITRELLKDGEFLEIVSPILNSKEFLKRKEWIHHENCSLYEHLLVVSYLSYKICKKRNWNYRDAAIGGILHDFYKSPWQKNVLKKKSFFKQHGFTHAREAMENAWKFFPEMMNERIMNIIERHMFPLNIIPPKYIEGWVVTYVDKRLSMDVVLNIKAFPKYLGLARMVYQIKSFFKVKRK